MHRTVAAPLACVYALLIVYASVCPTPGWRTAMAPVGSFLLEPFPRYWTWFDVLSNFAGYVPLGGLLGWWALRATSARVATIGVCFVASLLSLVLEGMQEFLQSRVPSREDWLLNSGGAALGASLSRSLRTTAVMGRWSVWRRRWFTGRLRWAIVLLSIWPLALPGVWFVGFGCWTAGPASALLHSASQIAMFLLPLLIPFSALRPAAQRLAAARLGLHAAWLVRACAGLLLAGAAAVLLGLRACMAGADFPLTCPVGDFPGLQVRFQHMGQWLACCWLVGVLLFAAGPVRSGTTKTRIPI